MRKGEIITNSYKLQSGSVLDKTKKTLAFRLGADPTANWALTMPTNPPASQQALVVDSAGVVSYQSLGGGGTLTDVTLTAPSIFTVGDTGGAAPTLSLALANQNINLVFASPASGGAGAPSFRSLVPNDIPALTAAWIAGFDTQVRTNRLDQMAAPTASINLNGQVITNGGAPVNPGDLVTKAFAEQLMQGITSRSEVEAGETVSNINIAAPGATIGGYSPAVGDDILLTANTNQAENGVWIWNGAGVALTRDPDVPAAQYPNLFLFVKRGTNADNGYICGNDTTPTLGTTAITFTQFSGAGQITAGNGLTKTGNTINAGGTTNRIDVAADTIDISANYVGQSSITTLGTISAGVWNGSTIAIANGGTGAITAAGARTALGVPTLVSATFTSTNVVAGKLTITLPSSMPGYPIVQLYDDQGLWYDPDNIRKINNTTIEVELSTLSFETITGTHGYSIMY